MPNGTRSTQARNGVFISYARSDGETFAKILLERLGIAGIQPVWLDRIGLEGGHDWWLQIEDALNRVEFLALVVTPNALKSDNVRKEWRYARQQGVCVYPVRATPALDLEGLPRQMQRAQSYDLGTVENGLDGPGWKKFINDLNTSCRTPRVPFMVEDLPEGFVPRRGEFDQLLNLLVDERREEAIAITAALKGAGGYGKTTLAKALCHDGRVQDAFDDGILWVTLGESPGDLTGRVEDLIVTLGDERPNFTALDASVNRLKELLADRDVLIVIDDVWDRAHLNPFVQGGPRCARLITTRNVDTLPAKTENVKVDAMQQNEATLLLVAGLDPVLLHGRSLSGELAALASRVGEWPLLLRLINSALRNRIENDKQSPRDAVTWINRALDRRGLGSFDARNSDERNMAVARTIGVSLDLLSDLERERYDELAIYPEDVEIPLATLEKLWAKTGGLDEFETEDLCSLLNRFSLLLNYDASQRYIRLHDVVRTFLIEQQPAKLPSIHAQLLDAHRPVASSPWSEMSTDEPYLWDHLAHHLVGANRGAELVATVKDWRYLAAKTSIRKSLAVEADLRAAEKVSSGDDSLRLLRRSFVNSGHLLIRSEKRADIEMILFSRLLYEPELKVLTTDLKDHLKRPCLMPAYTLPDLPHPALVRTLSGHDGMVIGCAVNGDVTTIVSASEDGTLKVWDGRNGTERFTLLGHMARVFGCALSEDGETIVSASEDQTLKVWNARSGTVRSRLNGHDGAVLGCAVSSDGSMIVSASEDGTLKIWDGETGAERFTLSGHDGAVSGCAVSASGATVVSASEDQTLKLWNGETGNELFTLRGHTGWVRGCAISADGKTIASASEDQTVRLWDTQSGTERLTMSGHEDWVRSCAVSANGATVVSASDDHTLKVWDGQSGAEVLTLSGHSGLVFGCAISLDGAVIVSASEDQRLKVWDARSAAESFLISGYAGITHRCAVSPDGTTIVSAADDRTLKVWDVRSGTRRFTLSGHSGPVLGCAVSVNGGTIVSASVDQTLKIWDGQSGNELFTLSGHAGVVLDCAVSADGSTIVSASDDQTLKLWDGATGTERFTMVGHTGWVRGCAMTADGKTIVSASEDQTLRVWDGVSGLERLILSGHTGWVNGCAITEDGATIVSASADWTLKVWDGRSGAERFTLSGHSEEVTDCLVTADGTIIISASEDETLKVWDGHTGECLSTLHLDGELYGCACSPDAEVIAASGVGGIYFLRLLR